MEVDVQRLTATDSATLKHAFLPKATLDRAQQLYMQIAQSDVECQHVAWNVKYSQRQQRVFTSSVLH